MTYHPHDPLAAIGVAPVLPGARCRGKHHLFDGAGKNEAPETVQQRHTQAVGLCRGCPALADCGTWLWSLPKSKRPTGVIAGRRPGPKPIGRPRKEPA